MGRDTFCWHPYPGHRDRSGHAGPGRNPGRPSPVALRPKVALLTELNLGSDAREAAWDGLVDFCAGAVRRHLSATDRALYTPVADAAGTRLSVRDLQAVSGDLDEKIDVLSRADDADAVATLAQHIEAVLAAHLAVEQTVLLPALAAVPGADLPTLASHWADLLDGDRLEPLPSTSPRLRSRDRSAGLPHLARRACAERGTGRDAGEAPAISRPSRSRGGSACRGAGGGR